MKKLLTIFIILFIAGIGYAQQNNVLLEFCTGTWCQWCPCGDAAADSILVDHPNALILAYHGPINNGDPFAVFNGNNILALMGMSNYPNATIGRRSGLLSYTGWRGQVTIQTNNYSPSPISYTYNRHYNPATRTIDLTVIATANRDIDTNCNINFVIYENNLIYFQQGGGCPGSNTWVHKWVVRNMVNGPTGESLSTGHWASGTTKTKTWTTTLDASWIFSNCDVGIFAYMVGPNLSGSSPVMQTKKESVNTFPTGVENPTEVPLQYNLSQNYPNPFNPTTSIHFTIEKDGIVNLEVYDILGNVVTTFSNGFMKAGEYNAQFDGSKLSSGIYLYKLTAGNFTETKKMMMVK